MYVPPFTPQPTPQQVRKALDELPKMLSPKPEPRVMKPQPGEWVQASAPGLPTSPSFTFHVKTKSLQVSIAGDGADALAAIRAVSSALEEHAESHADVVTSERSAGLELAS